VSRLAVTASITQGKNVDLYRASTWTRARIGTRPSCIFGCRVGTTLWTRALGEYIPSPRQIWFRSRLPM